MKSFKCPECGAPIKNDLGICDYCGVHISNEELNNDENSFKSFGEGLNDAVDSVKEAAKKLNTQNVNWLLLVILCAVCLPVGVIYFVLTVFGNDVK